MTGIVFTARLGSSRLARKHLLEVAGQPLIAYLLRRMQVEFQHELNNNLVQLAVVTSDEPENREFEHLAEASVYYGSIRNIPLRHLEAAHHFGWKAIVSIDGDDILCSPAAARAVFEGLSRGQAFVKTKGLPFGMNASGYSVEFLEASLQGHTDEIAETGWFRLFDATQAVNIDFGFGEDQRLRFTLDYPEDFDFFRATIAAMGERIYSAKNCEIVDVVLQEQLYRINGDLAAEYWENYHRGREAETAASQPS